MSSKYTIEVVITRSASGTANKSQCVQIHFSKMLSSRYRITRLSVIACVLYLAAESSDCDVNFRPTDYMRYTLCVVVMHGSSRGGEMRCWSWHRGCFMAPRWWWRKCTTSNANTPFAIRPIQLLCPICIWRRASMKSL